MWRIKGFAEILIPEVDYQVIDSPLKHQSSDLDPTIVKWILKEANSRDERSEGHQIKNEGFVAFVEKLKQNSRAPKQMNGSKSSCLKSVVQLVDFELGLGEKRLEEVKEKARINQKDDSHSQNKYQDNDSEDLLNVLLFFRLDNARSDNPHYVKATTDWQTVCGFKNSGT